MRHTRFFRILSSRKGSIVETILIAMSSNKGTRSRVVRLVGSSLCLDKGGFRVVTSSFSKVVGSLVGASLFKTSFSVCFALCVPGVEFWASQRCREGVLVVLVFFIGCMISLLRLCLNELCLAVEVDVVVVKLEVFFH